MSKNFEYIVSIKKYILLAATIFILFTIVGAKISYQEPDKSKDTSEKSKDVPNKSKNVSEQSKHVAKDISSIIPKSASKLDQISIIIRNNIINSILAIIGAGIPIMVYDGLTFGMIFSFMGSHGYAYLLGIVPHFIIEMSAIIIGSGIGIRFFHLIYISLGNKQVEIKSELVTGFSAYLKWVVPMIIIAALTEVFVTQSLFKILTN